MTNRTYTVVIESDGRTFSAYVPDLPGCVTAGDSEDDVRRLIKEAIEFHLEGMIEDGEVIPEPSTRIAVTQVNVASAA
jgi:predicted RNase H-like HicB family nuclease